jgi:hypothetical protein
MSPRALARFSSIALMFWYVIRIFLPVRELTPPRTLASRRVALHAVAMSSGALPACGLYRTAAPLGGITADRLVYFHNHGDPGPGLYLPESWTANRAHFSPRGATLPSGFDQSALIALPPEGFYRVAAAFYCCAKRCVQLEPDAFVQLGYNGAGRALVFTPELASGSIAIPDHGTLIDDAVLPNLVALRVSERSADNLSFPRGILVH